MFGGKAGDWYDPCYHQLCDDVGNVNLTAWVVNTKVRLSKTWALNEQVLKRRSSSLIPLRRMRNLSRAFPSASLTLRPSQLPTGRMPSTMVTSCSFSCLFSVS